MIATFNDNSVSYKNDNLSFSEINTEYIYICKQTGWIGKKINTSKGMLFLYLNRKNENDYEAFFPGENFKFNKYCSNLTFVVK